MHRQADALSESARALEQAAELMRVQAELYERTVAPRVRRPKWRRVSRASAGAIGSRPAGRPWLPRMTRPQAGRTVESPPELPIEPRSLP